jgi:hypothetical protein
MLARLPVKFVALTFLSNIGIFINPVMSSPAVHTPHYRADGVRITHNPFAPGMAAKYGAPGATDRDGFDPYADSVGAGIYSGTVKRREVDGSVLIGAQYQGHNPRPGPVYSGGGYTPISRAIAEFHREVMRGADESATTLARLLDAHPDLVNDVATGGATPLHTCGMSRENQHATAFLISKGGDVAAVDTYGFTPLARMASNNLAVGAQALLLHGADPSDASNPVKVAKQSEAAAVASALAAHGSKRRADRRVSRLTVFSEVRPEVAGDYAARPGSEVPKGFADVCLQNKWDVDSTWKKLNGGEGGSWFKHAANDSYVYFNALDGMWWIDGPDGLGVYKVQVHPLIATSAPNQAFRNRKLTCKNRVLGRTGRRWACQLHGALSTAAATSLHSQCIAREHASNRHHLEALVNNCVPYPSHIHFSSPNPAVL